jgi:hypothetical protein
MACVMLDGFCSTPKFMAIDNSISDLSVSTVCDPMTAKDGKADIIVSYVALHAIRSLPCYYLTGFEQKSYEVCTVLRKRL